MTSSVDLIFLISTINIGRVRSIVCSSNGQKISTGGTRRIYNNSNYGSSTGTGWYTSSITGSFQNWTFICYADSVDYLFGILNGRLLTSNELNGNIYGLNWTNFLPAQYNPRGLCCSSSGSFVAMNINSAIYYTNNGLSISPSWETASYTSNYGSNLLCCSTNGLIIAFLNNLTENDYETFNLVVGYYENNNFSFIYATETLTGSTLYSSICMSNYGDYIHICTQGTESTPNGNVYTYKFVNNNNPTLTLLYNPPNPDPTSSWIWSAICCDLTGQYVAAVLSTVSTYNSGIYISNDYGNSYQGFYISNTQELSYNWTTCCCDSNFNYLYLTNASNNNILSGIYQAKLNILPPTPEPDPDPTPTPPPTPNNNFSTPNIVLNENSFNRPYSHHNSFNRPYSHHNSFNRPYSHHNSFNRPYSHDNSFN